MNHRAESSPVKRAVAWISDLVDRRPGLCVLVGVLLALPAVWLTSQLHIDQNFRRLLPDNAVEVKRLDATDHRIGNQSDLVLAIRSPDREANIAFGTKLADALRARATPCVGSDPTRGFKEAMSASAADPATAWHDCFVIA